MESAHEVIEKFQVNKRTAYHRFPIWCSQSEKFCFIRPRKCPEIHTGIWSNGKCPTSFVRLVLVHISILLLRMELFRYWTRISQLKFYFINLSFCCTLWSHTGKSFFCCHHLEKDNHTEIATIRTPKIKRLRVVMVRAIASHLCSVARVNSGPMPYVG